MLAKFTHLLVPLGDALPNEVQNKVETVVGWVTTISISICILGVIVAGAMMAIGQRRGEGGEHAARLGWVLAGCIVIGTASALVNAIV
ncbi:Conjugal transfer protein TrbC [Kribbella flavida DSM 17836]|uniref:Conjugal transfer protein TrbC n=1 Tax=Kribbella flavida (strain DSM 17836 / JCM 10339 / NBRC 14399) TaxID=479435 RepID=D2Q3W0_KRIFD|nr:TrbC/VirB2 family protein [Kribbella flavida]ADB35982.1 Conjugal transfer protein TrbC [Kribbella flavida DSM 17836]